MKLLRPISAILLALLVLVSTTSFRVGIHFCMGKVKSISVFTKAEQCKPRAVKQCHIHQEPNCCKDENVVHAGDDLKSSYDNLLSAASQDIQVVDHGVLIAEIIPSSKSDRLTHINYDPPVPADDLVIQLRVLII